LVAIVTVYLGVVVLAGAFVIATARFADLVPQYSDQMTDLVSGIHGLMSTFGVSQEQIQSVVDALDLSQLAGVVASVLSGVLGLLSNLVFIMALVLFMCVDATGFGTQLQSSRGHHSAFVEAMDRFAHGTRKYFLVSTVFGLIVAVLDTAFLLIVGIPAAFLWGLLSFITNYIPNVGFVLGLVPPAMLALLEGGPGLALVVIAGYSVINFVIQSIIQPKLVGDAVGMSATITFLSLVVWAWIIGPLGAILAIPLSLLIKAFFVDVDPQLQWVARLMGDNRQPEPAAAGPVPQEIAEEPVGTDQRLSTKS
jgi:predicted PurR-regulated permease PerM